MDQGETVFEGFLAASQKALRCGGKGARVVGLHDDGHGGFRGHGHFVVGALAQAGPQAALQKGVLYVLLAGGGGVQLGQVDAGVAFDLHHHRKNRAAVAPVDGDHLAGGGGAEAHRFVAAVHKQRGADFDGVSLGNL